MSTSDSYPFSPTTKGRTLVLCFDGTTNHYGDDNTDVVNFFSLVKKDSDDQLCYYQAGIGTYFAPGVVSPLFQWCAKVLDEAIAWYLDAHVMDGYRFVCQNYRPGDKICLFGFSRGAYTARCVAGMLYKVGLLPRDNEEQINFAYKLYARTDKESDVLAKGFKETFSRDVKIDFVGVWDTVASVGVISGRTLPFTDSCSAIRTFRHVLSLDEHRAKFRPNQYHYTAPSESAGKKDPEHASMPKGAQGGWSSSSAFSKMPLLQKRGKTAPVSTPSDEGPPTDVKEVWFVGCHSDVGGGAVSNSETSNLSAITLRWMVREIEQSKCGILLDEKAVERLNISITMSTQRNSADAAFAQKQDELGDVTNGHGTQFSFINETTKPASKAKGLDNDDAVDALRPIHDDLSIKTTWQAAFWWIMEIFPTHYSYQDINGVWHTEWNSHLGRGRKIEDLKPNFHATVKARMENKSMCYSPRANWIKGQEVYVD